MRYRMAVGRSDTLPKREMCFAEGETLEELVAMAVAKAVVFDEPGDTWASNPNEFRIYESTTEVVYRRVT